MDIIRRREIRSICPILIDNLAAFCALNSDKFHFVCRYSDDGFVLYINFNKMGVKTEEEHMVGDVELGGRKRKRNLCGKATKK